MFDKYSAEAGKKQYLIPYFIAAHPGTSDEDMMNLALWLKKNGFRADQVQTFYPSPMATATAMYHTGSNPLRKITRESETVDIVRGEQRRRLHKAFLRYHDANNWPLLREALKTHGPRRPDRQRQAPADPDLAAADRRRLQSARRKNSTPRQRLPRLPRCGGAGEALEGPHPHAAHRPAAARQRLGARAAQQGRRPGARQHPQAALSQRAQRASKPAGRNLPTARPRPPCGPAPSPSSPP